MWDIMQEVMLVDEEFKGLMEGFEVTEEMEVVGEMLEIVRDVLRGCRDVPRYFVTEAIRIAEQADSSQNTEICELAERILRQFDDHMH